jgi:hypothetical protein
MDMDDCEVGKLRSDQEGDERGVTLWWVGCFLPRGFVVESDVSPPVGKLLNLKPMVA